MTADQKIDFHRPLGAASAAFRVSSEIWADASYPMIVYIGSNMPSGNTYHQNMSSLKPDRLSLCRNTNATS